MFRLCSSSDELQRLPHGYSRNTQVRKRPLWTSCWIRVPSSPHTTFHHRHNTASDLPGKPPCAWIHRCNHICTVVLQPPPHTSSWERTASPNSPCPYASLQRWLLHNKQHLLLISPKNQNNTRSGGKRKRGGKRGVGRGSPHMRRFSFSREELSGKKENEELHFWLWRRHIFSPHVGSLSPFLQRGTQALLGQLYKQKERKNWNKGRGEAGRTLPYPQERICNSAAAAALITVRLCWSLQQKVRAKREKTARNGEGTWKPGWAESLDRGGEWASLDCKQSVYELKSHRFNADCRKTSNKLDCAAYTLLEANNMTRNHPLSFTGTLKEGQRKPWEMDYKYSTRSLIYWGNRLILRLPKFSAEL